jgi:predicted RNase H-like HicB family nuclease
MSREFNVVIERDEEGYYIASVPSLPGCHTQARSLGELMERIREAIAACLEHKAGESNGMLLRELEQRIAAADANPEAAEAWEEVRTRLSRKS